MSLRAHLHLLLPSSFGDIDLEARLYLPRDAPGRAPLPWSTSTRSTPTHLDAVSREGRDELRTIGISTLITAAHPWHKLGGNMLDPVLSECLAGAIFDPPRTEERIALLTFNARGVGASGGSGGLLGLSTTTSEGDFAEVEGFIASFLSPRQIRRVGYSWGCVAALNAPPKSSVHSTLLVSPPSTLFGFTTLLSSRRFSTALTSAGMDVTVIHGTEDQFNSVSAFRDLARYPRVDCIEVDGADHFFRDGRSSADLTVKIRQWLER